MLDNLSPEGAEGGTLGSQLACFAAAGLTEQN